MNSGSSGDSSPPVDPLTPPAADTASIEAIAPPVADTTSNIPMSPPVAAVNADTSPVWDGISNGVLEAPVTATAVSLSNGVSAVVGDSGVELTALPDSARLRQQALVTDSVAAESARVAAFDAPVVIPAAPVVAVEASDAALAVGGVSVSTSTVVSPIVIPAAPAAEVDAANVAVALPVGGVPPASVGSSSGPAANVGMGVTAETVVQAAATGAPGSLPAVAIPSVSPYIADYVAKSRANCKAKFDAVRIKVEPELKIAKKILDVLIAEAMARGIKNVTVWASRSSHPALYVSLPGRDLSLGVPGASYRSPRVDSFGLGTDETEIRSFQGKFEDADVAVLREQFHHNLAALALLAWDYRFTGFLTQV